MRSVPFEKHLQVWQACQSEGKKSQEMVTLQALIFCSPLELCKESLGRGGGQQVCNHFRSETGHTDKNPFLVSAADKKTSPLAFRWGQFGLK